MQNPQLNSDHTKLDVASFITHIPRQRDFLIEAMHCIHDAFGCITRNHLAFLANEFQVSKAETFEVAAFYDHFQIDHPQNAIALCMGPACLMAGAEAIYLNLHSQGSKPSEASCLGACNLAPAAMFNNSRFAPFIKLDSEAKGDKKPINLTSQSLTLPVPLSAEKILAALESAELRGFGGAGFPTAAKWRSVIAAEGKPYVVVNADEGEPGAFKDRYCLEQAPEKVLTGALVAASVVGAQAIYFYIRNEYYDLIDKLISVAETLVAFYPGITFHWRRGAGSYVCGEETALLESIEGRPAIPRHKPPYPAQNGLFGMPTLVNNVETFYWVYEVLANGPQWFADQGLRGEKGVRLYSVSGRVSKPGVFHAPIGITLAELIEDYCGGMAADHTLQAYFPGGASGGVLPASLADIPMSYRALENFGASLGSASVIVLSQHDNVQDVVTQFMKFFSLESCGQCAPCRLGTVEASSLLTQSSLDLRQSNNLAELMEIASICGLGQGAGRLLMTYVKHFFGGK